MSSNKEILYQIKDSDKTILQLSTNGIILSKTFQQKHCVTSNSVQVQYPGLIVQLTFSKPKKQRTFVTVTIQPTEGPVELSRLQLRWEYLPDEEPEQWDICKKCFHWLPNLKTESHHFAGSHSFRSPAAILTRTPLPEIALIPHLDKENPATQWMYLDMGMPDSEAPWLEWGLCQQEPVGHVYYQPSLKPIRIEKTLTASFWLLERTEYHIAQDVNSFLWLEYADDYRMDTKPVVLPVRQYASYGYSTALEHLWREGSNRGGGITNVTYQTEDGRWQGRRYPNDLWFHVWFNNARTAWGLGYWGHQFANTQWVLRADEIIDLALSAKTWNGIPYAIDAPQSGGWKASDSASGGEHLLHIPDAAWTGIWVLEYGQSIRKHVGMTDYLRALAQGILSIQSEDGGFPNWVHIADGTHDDRLNGSTSAAMLLWFLGEYVLKGKPSPGERDDILRSLHKGLKHLYRVAAPKKGIEDFELYFSCSKKPLDFFDPWTHLHGMNTLSLQWYAEAFRVASEVGELYPKSKLAKSKLVYKNEAYTTLQILLLFQQVWNPPYLSLYTFGGFGVMNTDAEWSDARQAQFAETILNFYLLTQRSELKERAIAAARASFALMVCDEHKEICPKNYLGTERQFEHHGMMAENYGHDGVDERSYQSSFHWGTGSALTTAARFHQRGFPIDKR